MAATITGNQTGTVGLINTATAQNSTSGTSIGFTGIPSGVRRVTVMFRGVSITGSGALQIQIGSGSYSTTGYATTLAYISGASAQAFSYTTGFYIVNSMGASYLYSGVYTLNMLSSNAWVGSGNSSLDNIANAIFMSAGQSPTLGGALDRVQITGSGGEVFDAGTINILYE